MSKAIAPMSSPRKSMIPDDPDRTTIFVQQLRYAQVIFFLVAFVSSIFDPVKSLCRMMYGMEMIEWDGDFWTFSQVSKMHNASDPLVKMVTADYYSKSQDWRKLTALEVQQIKQYTTNGDYWTLNPDVSRSEYAYPPKSKPNSSPKVKCLFRPSDIHSTSADLGWKPGSLANFPHHAAIYGACYSEDTIDKATYLRTFPNYDVSVYTWAATIVDDNKPFKTDGIEAHVLPMDLTRDKAGVRYVFRGGSGGYHRTFSGNAIHFAPQAGDRKSNCKRAPRVGKNGSTTEMLFIADQVIYRGLILKDGVQALAGGNHLAYAYNLFGWITGVVYECAGAPLSCSWFTEGTTVINFTWGAWVRSPGTQGMRFAYGLRIIFWISVALARLKYNYSFLFYSPKLTLSTILSEGFFSVHEKERYGIYSLAFAIETLVSWPEILMDALRYTQAPDIGLFTTALVLSNMLKVAWLVMLCNTIITGIINRLPIFKFIIRSTNAEALYPAVAISAVMVYNLTENFTAILLTTYHAYGNGIYKNIWIRDVDFLTINDVGIVQSLGLVGPVITSIIIPMICMSSFLAISKEILFGVHLRKGMKNPLEDLCRDIGIDESAAVIYYYPIASQRGSKLLVERALLCSGLFLNSDSGCIYYADFELTRLKTKFRPTKWIYDSDSKKFTRKSKKFSNEKDVNSITFTVNLQDCR